MKTLNLKNVTLIRQAINTVGWNGCIIGMIEERLTFEEYKFISNFLVWLQNHRNDYQLNNDSAYKEAFKDFLKQF